MTTMPAFMKATVPITTARAPTAHRTNTDSTVAAVQEQLAQQGYYRGEIDGIFGAGTRRAVVRYQSDHGLRVTGNLNADTLQALGLRRVASN
jgi:peptidoglycan hydrolase-like protein with peptidoglycan-binding domain